MIRSKLFSLALSLTVITLGAIGTFGQGQERRSASFTADKYLVSAKAGGVNFVDGSVAVTRATGKTGLILKGDQLEIGDRVVSDTISRAEVLLNPGSYLRLGSDSAFEFMTTSLDDLQIKLESGSAMFEVFAANEFTVSIFTPKGKAVLVESGVYRIDISSDGYGVIAVTQGKALVGPAETVVKKGRTGTIGTPSVTIAKFDRGRRDDLAEWSKTRAKGLARLTDTLKNKAVRQALANAFLGRRWGFRDSFGLWVLDPFTRGYCFLPFGYGWYSPYGYGFNNGLYWYDLPQIIRTPIRQPPIEPGEGTKTGRTVGRSYEPPPYVTMEKTHAPVRSIRDDFPADSWGRGPTYQPSTSAPAPVFAPAPTGGGRGNKPID